MNYICKNCQSQIEDIALAMVQGCDCGHRVFKQIKNFDNSDDIKEISDKITKIKQDQYQVKADGDVAILVKGKGVYSVNIDALLNRSSGIDPILVQDRKGVINVVLNPDP